MSTIDDLAKRIAELSTQHDQLTNNNKIYLQHLNKYGLVQVANNQISLKDNESFIKLLKDEQKDRPAKEVQKAKK